MIWNKDLIIIKDNFLDETLFKKIYSELDKVKFVNRSTHKEGETQKIYFNAPLSTDHPAPIALKSFFKAELGMIINKMESFYFLSAKHEEPSPHDDTPGKINCIIYLKGPSLVHNGTALYEKNGEMWNINSHIGFKENRAIIFSSHRKHASLQFEQGATGRYLIANFIKDYDLE